MLCACHPHLLRLVELACALPPLQAARTSPRSTRSRRLCFQPPARFGRAYMRQLVDQPERATWIAEEDGQHGRLCHRRVDAGCRTRPSPIFKPSKWSPDMRGRGIGGELLRRVEASACAAGAQAIWLHVDAENCRGHPPLRTRTAMSAGQGRELLRAQAAPRSSTASS